MIRKRVQMSNNEDNGKTPPRGRKAEDVLARVAGIAGAKNDAALARALKVSPQTLSSWRKRSTVPYEAITGFAADRDIALDHLILGRGDGRVSSGAVDAALFQEIAMAILDGLKEKGFDPSKDLGYEFAGTRLGYYACLVYNRIERLRPQEVEPIALVAEEVKYLLDLKTKGNADPDPNIYPEEAQHLRSAFPEEVYGIGRKPMTGARKKRGRDRRPRSRS